MNDIIINEPDNLPPYADTFSLNDEMFPFVCHVTNNVAYEKMKKHGKIGEFPIANSADMKSMYEQIKAEFIAAGMLNTQCVITQDVSMKLKTIIKSPWEPIRVLQNSLDGDQNYQYNHLYFTNNLMRLDLYARNRSGEYLLMLLKMYFMFEKYTGKFIQFTDPLQQNLINTYFNMNADNEKDIIKKEIYSVVLIFRNLPVNRFENESGSINFKQLIDSDYCLKFLAKRGQTRITDLFLSQKSFRYIGEPLRLDEAVVLLCRQNSASEAVKAYIT